MKKLPYCESRLNMFKMKKIKVVYWVGASLIKLLNLSIIRNDRSDTTNMKYEKLKQPNIRVGLFLFSGGKQYISIDNIGTDKDNES